MAVVKLPGHTVRVNPCQDRYDWTCHRETGRPFPLVMLPQGSATLPPGILHERHEVKAHETSVAYVNKGRYLGATRAKQTIVDPRHPRRFLPH